MHALAPLTGISAVREPGRCENLSQFPGPQRSRLV